MEIKKEKCDECEEEIAEFFIEMKSTNLKTNEEECLYIKLVCENCKNNI